mmetsp:Transcript_13014/g.35463  ORF Transcript_13014/g.35463 Transcript_13014/m.35463 type:complete len:227 (-) Transcript_13014:422-1102(-)
MLSILSNDCSASFSCTCASTTSDFVASHRVLAYFTASMPWEVLPRTSSNSVRATSSCFSAATTASCAACKLFLCCFLSLSNSRAPALLFLNMPSHRLASCWTFSKADFSLWTRRWCKVMRGPIMAFSFSEMPSCSSSRCTRCASNFFSNLFSTNMSASNFAICLRRRAPSSMAPLPFCSECSSKCWRATCSACAAARFESSSGMPSSTLPTNLLETGYTRVLSGNF